MVVNLLPVSVVGFHLCCVGDTVSILLNCEIVPPESFQFPNHTTSPPYASALFLSIIFDVLKVYCVFWSTGASWQYCGSSMRAFFGELVLLRLLLLIRFICIPNAFWSFANKGDTMPLLDSGMREAMILTAEKIARPHTGEEGLK